MFFLICSSSSVSLLTRTWPLVSYLHNESLGKAGLHGHAPDPPVPAGSGLHLSPTLQERSSDPAGMRGGPPCLPFPLQGTLCLQAFERPVALWGTHRAPVRSSPHPATLSFPDHRRRTSCSESCSYNRSPNLCPSWSPWDSQHPAGEVLLDGVRLDTRLTASKDAGSEKLLHCPLGPLLGHKGHGVPCPLHAFPPLMSLSTRLWKRCVQFTVSFRSPPCMTSSQFPSLASVFSPLQSKDAKSSSPGLPGPHDQFLDRNPQGRTQSDARQTSPPTGS